MCSNHIVTLGNCNHEYVTPLIKFWLKKRRILQKNGRRKEVDELADKSNSLINKQRASSLSKPADTTPTELWASVNVGCKHTGSSLCNGIL